MMPVTHFKYSGALIVSTWDSKYTCIVSTKRAQLHTIVW